jgi:hypothetical protein
LKSAGEDSDFGARRGDIKKVEAFENWKFFQVSEERVQAQEEATAALRSAGEKRSGPLVLTSREQQRSAQEEEIVSIRSCSGSPTTVRSVENGIWIKPS